MKAYSLEPSMKQLQQTIDEDVAGNFATAADLYEKVLLLDYRENLEDPSVFFMPHYCACWTRLAPNFAAFRELIIPYDADEFDRREDEDE